MKLTQHELDAFAIKMMSAGLRPTIAEGVTGLPRKRILALRPPSETRKTKGGSMPSTSGICTNSERVLDATLFVKLYSKVAERPADEVDIEALIEAHREYSQLHKEMRLGHTNETCLLSADECFVLARDFRQAAIWFDYCGNCRIEYLVSEKPLGRSIHYACPVCLFRANRESRMYTAPTTVTDPASVDFDIKPAQPAAAPKRARKPRQTSS